MSQPEQIPAVPEPKDMDTALEFLEHSGHVSSDVVQALRQVVENMSKEKRTECPATTDPVAEGRDGPRSLQAARKFKPASSKRQQLTAEEAAEIYLMRPTVSGKGARPKRGSMICCKSIAPKFGVSAKTIRDIWRGRTWVDATKHLWTPEELERRAQGADDQSDSDNEAEDSKMRGRKMSESKNQQKMLSLPQANVPNFQHPSCFDFSNEMFHFQKSCNLQMQAHMPMHSAPEQTSCFQQQRLNSGMPMLGVMPSFSHQSQAPAQYQFDFPTFTSNTHPSLYNPASAMSMNHYSDPNGMRHNAAHLLNSRFPHFR